MNSNDDDDTYPRCSYKSNRNDYIQKRNVKPLKVYNCFFFVSNKNKNIEIDKMQQVFYHLSSPTRGQMLYVLVCRRIYSDASTDEHNLFRTVAQKSNDKFLHKK